MTNLSGERRVRELSERPFDGHAVLRSGSKAVFDIANSKAGVGVVRGFGSGIDFYARRTDADRRPARSNVTAQLMGDPRPGRSAQDKFEREGDVDQIMARLFPRVSTND